WRDGANRSAELVLLLRDPAGKLLAPGKTYGLWAVGGEAAQPLGLIDPANPNASFSLPDAPNLVAAFDRLVVAEAADPQPATPPAAALFAGAVPPEALVHVRHLLVSVPNTPEKIGFGLGLRAQSDLVLQHSQFLLEAQQAGDFALERVHAEHIINMIVGAKSPDFADHSGDGKTQNPGDGFGLLRNGTNDGYIDGLINHAKLAAETGDATELVKLHSGHVQIAGENSHQRSVAIVDLAKKILGAADAAASEADAQALVLQAEQLVRGFDANADETIAPVPGEGGVLTAYEHAQLMASVELFPPAADAPAAPGDNAAQGEQAPPPANQQPGNPLQQMPPQQLSMPIQDNQFAIKEIRVPLGSTITWQHAGTRPHTVTADDEGFDSGSLNPGQSFAQTFDKPGTFAYFCAFHGGPDGTGMSAVVIVQ
ncbi:MAG TPA: plastocyanin/azurin family copper-binding protein, partial [Herpetosiphonaceae bacterium]